jgi:DNA-binding NarL/FixJ family response regulator
MRSARLLLADDHAIMTEGLVALLKDSFDVVGTVRDGAAMVEAAERLHPDVIVSDMSMPGMSGLEALARLKKHGVDARVVFLTMHSEPEIAASAIRAGASAFLLKASASKELVHAIDEVLQGRVYLSPAVTKDVIQILQAPHAKAFELSDRQRDVLRLIVQGKRMKEIAALLDLSPRTVETHKYDMMRTLSVRSTAELIRYALEHDLA